MAQLIPIIQVVGAWVVKVDRQFHQPQTQHSGVEIDIALRVASNCRYMMNAQNILTHRLSPFSPSCTEHVILGRGSQPPDEGLPLLNIYRRSDNTFCKKGLPQ